ncbi:hypothetical protein ABZ920_26765 [Streptomyces sp. NPDC046831]|uniref:hypothetical protein n=1 Tax=Streptomyces sp. NPDC046831 TaxID=3154805 RepID=UPI0033D2F270
MSDRRTAPAAFAAVGCLRRLRGAPKAEPALPGGFRPAGRRPGAPPRRPPAGRPGGPRTFRLPEPPKLPELSESSELPKLSGLPKLFELSQPSGGGG